MEVTRKSVAISQDIEGWSCCLFINTGCQYEDRIIVSGDTFIPLTRPCDVCRCDNGDVTCRQTPCPDLHDCQSTTTLDGECCPMCLDCGDHANATTWREGPCQNCACINGRVSCSKIQCSRPDCAHPYTPNGECCPVCVACFYQGRIIQDGERFQPDRCTNCTCHHGNVDCIQKQCPEARCIKPIQPQGECCPICDSDCDYNQRIYRHNEVFIAAYDPCLNCSCMNSMVRCTPIQCNLQNLPCRNPVRRGEGCCDFVCQGCIEAGIEHSNGDQWTSLRDPCEVCVCNEGQVICQTRHTCSVQCSHGVIPRGECCSSCTDCLYDGRVIQDGQVFPHPGDVCQQCLCHSGNIRCEAVRNCPVLSCTVTEMEPGGCCQRCKGEVVCTRVQCSPPRCNNPIQLPGECCPECRGCEYGGENFQEGQRFTPRLQPCLTCLCQEGKAICESQESNCPQATCTHPERIPGQCCPSCIGCIYLRRRFKNGQKFVPPGGDPCRVCRCSEGSVTCTQMECSTPNCNNPVRPPGHCCAVCPMGCTILGKEYRDGQTFVDPRDGCKVCTCMVSSIVLFIYFFLITTKISKNVCPEIFPSSHMGEIGCMEMGCTEGTPDCTHPVKRQSECCPSCTMCSYKNQIIRNGQTFTDPENTCLQCVCRVEIIHQDTIIQCYYSNLGVVKHSIEFTLLGQILNFIANLGIL
ncbi:hypothetical protein KUTeg_007451 [Tegillarca granosa]|uniref:VWFC domain-containing protein n=1 Tax=Tegillarca granosa TaxID=220873 RepID=A0ABQ9FFA2_TEGGR|nr:hypothetical protein KUTeg_007451 [Tegillarca granosa]